MKKQWERRDYRKDELPTGRERPVGLMCIDNHASSNYACFLLVHSGYKVTYASFLSDALNLIHGSSYDLYVVNDELALGLIQICSRRCARLQGRRHFVFTRRYCLPVQSAFSGKVWQHPETPVPLTEVAIAVGRVIADISTSSVASTALHKQRSTMTIGQAKKLKATTLLHKLGQSLWLDNITRDLLDGGLLKRYINELSVTGLTSNPTIFEHAIKNSTAYDVDIREKLKEGKSEEEVFFELALADLTRAADLFRPIYDQTNGLDGWVSLEVSLLLAHDTAPPLLRRKICLPERVVQTSSSNSRHEGRIAAIEEAIFAGVPVNVTLLFFSRAIPGGDASIPARNERRIRPG
jgi:hypothetical protein